MRLKPEIADLKSSIAMKTKPEIRSPKSEKNPKAEIRGSARDHRGPVRASEFGLFSDFGFRSDFLLGYLLLAIGYLLAPAHADVPEPDNVIYGAITLGATAVTAANTNVVIEARKAASGPVVASYRMGDNPTYANAYSLEIPLEAFFPLANTNASRVGALLYLTVRDNSGVRDTRTLAIAQRGQLVRLDFTELDTDGDSLPDRWETQYFGSAASGDPNTDPDGDGRNNLQEFIDGTNPLAADGRHPADDSPADNVLSLEEAGAYANAWLTGANWPGNPTNIPIAYVARAATLALNATPYIFTNAPTTNAPLWWVNLPYAGPRAPGANIATSLALPNNPSPNALFTVTLHIMPTNSVAAFAVQDRPPTGWTNVQNISHGGFYDPVNGQIKWGPFYDSGTRDLAYEVVPPSGDGGTNNFAGIASFDGFNVVITGARAIVLPDTSPPAEWVTALIDNTSPVLTFPLRGAPARRYAVEVSTDLTTWSILQTNITDAGGAYLLRVTNTPTSGPRFYRARSVN